MDNWLIVALEVHLNPYISNGDSRSGVKCHPLWYRSATKLTALFFRQVRPNGQTDLALLFPWSWIFFSVKAKNWFLLVLLIFSFSSSSPEPKKPKEDKNGANDYAVQDFPLLVLELNLVMPSPLLLLFGKRWEIQEGHSPIMLWHGQWQPRGLKGV